MTAFVRRVVPALCSLAFFAAAPDSARANGVDGDPGPPGHLTVSGSSTMAPLLAAIARRFRERVDARAEIVVTRGGAARGIANVRANENDIGMVSRGLTREEADLKAFPIARDGLCMLVHRDNALVRQLSNAQIADIYTGRIANWKVVGGGNAPIHVISYEDGYSSLELFVQYFKVDKAAIRAHAIVSGDQEIILAVSEDPDAIAYTSIGQAERGLAKSRKIRLLPLGGVAASNATVQSRAFPLLRPLLLVTKGPPTGLAKRFIDYSMSAEVVDLIREQEFVPNLQ